MSKSSASSEPRNSARSALRVLAVTNAYPSPERPTAGIFLAEQVEGLRRAGVAIEVVLFDRLKEGVRSYFGVGARLAEPIRTFDPDVIHVLYGGVLADRVARTAADRPVVVTYHGSDLQGSALAPLRVQLMAEYGVWCSRRAARHAAGIIVVARHLVRFLPEESRPKARVIPCGIDLERFRPLDRDACRGRSRARQYDNEETALRLKDLYGEVLRSRQPHSTPPPRLAVSGVDS
ncbi:MAG: glycosyltransferase [Acidobacteria bacterium]|nr:glycosyltransferase [Acidobacteriota bacterium]